MRQRQVLVDVAIALALASLVVIGYKLTPQLSLPSELTVAAPAGCDLNASACSAELPGIGRVELAITPRPIPLVRPLEVSARIAAQGVEGVEGAEIDFSGVSMDMGKNRVSLVAEGGGIYRASAMLPVCVSGRMDWRATLRVRASGRIVAVAFDFSAPPKAD